MQIPDNYDRWAQHDAEQERQLQMLPKCSECGEHIQQERLSTMMANGVAKNVKAIFGKESEMIS